MFTAEEAVSRWEDQREIKNLMGKYANCIVQNREQEIFERFWAADAGVSLMFNDGAYVGQEAVSGYYDACRARNLLVARLLKQSFPHKVAGEHDEEIYGVGPFKALPMSCPVIELAQDGRTAKGLWFCQGTYSKVDACGPASNWTWGYYAADFIREEGGWKLWHMQYLNDVDCLCGQSWAEPQKPYPLLPEFAPLRDFSYPPYTVKQNFRTLYTKDRPLTPTPPIPKPYTTFAETFSYGV